ncbi:MAG: phage integrase SAM-like domain-containing protein, partial [Fuerstiella sp.]
MASVNKDSKGWRVLFVDPNGDRKTLRPGKGTNKATAEQIGRYVDVLVAHVCSKGILDRQAAIWLGDIGDKLHAKLVRAGLTEPRVVAEAEPEPEADVSITLAAFLDDFVDAGVTLKGNAASVQTRNKWRGTRGLLLECFDGTKPLNSMSLADAKGFRKWMERRKLPKTKRTPTGKMAENSMRQRIANCKAFFSYAVREELLPNNPFRNQVSTLIENEDGKQIIATEVINNVIHSAPDVQWKLLIALWRFAGLRKMEPLELNWDDVLWGEGKLRVRSPKTRHHQGKEMRYVPIRDVLTYLE